MVVTVSEMGVTSFTPGPSRWKLWARAESFTWIVYSPGARCVTGTPPWVREIVAASVTVATSCACATPGAARSASPQTNVVTEMRPMPLQVRGPVPSGLTSARGEA